jgi:hypothetical protein
MYSANHQHTYSPTVIQLHWENRGRGGLGNLFNPRLGGHSDGVSTLGLYLGAIYVADTSR